MPYDPLISGPLIAVNAEEAHETVQLPPLALASYGTIYHIIKIDASANTVTISAATDETINGELEFVLEHQYDKVSIGTDGKQWLIL